MNPITGSELKKWGDKFFYLPHGLSIDSEGNYWLTDVAMHQVFKFGPGGGREPILVLGEPFTPGTSNQQFCKPTSVAVHSQTKEVFIADGYCNSRLMKFSASGEYIMHWGHGGISNLGFQIPHKVVLVEQKDEACISDRERGQIECLNIRDEKKAAVVISPSGVASLVFHLFRQMFAYRYVLCSHGAEFKSIRTCSYNGLRIVIQRA